jgi:endoglucanase
MLNADSLRFLERLMNTPSPFGFEQEAQRQIRAHAGRHCDRAESDVHGNLILARNEQAPLRVMLAGHVDEIGFMVRHIDARGFVHSMREYNFRESKRPCGGGGRVSARSGNGR